jgi:hypothetical protein
MLVQPVNYELSLIKRNYFRKTNPTFTSAIPKALPTGAEQKVVAESINHLAEKLGESVNSRAKLTEIFNQLKK